MFFGLMIQVIALFVSLLRLRLTSLSRTRASWADASLFWCSIAGLALAAPFPVSNILYCPITSPIALKSVGYVSICMAVLGIHIWSFRRIRERDSLE